jgi:hypothetical protein
MSCFCLEHARDREDSLRKPGDESAHDVRANSPESLPPAHDQSLVSTFNIVVIECLKCLRSFVTSGSKQIYWLLIFHCGKMKRLLLIKAAVKFSVKRSPRVKSIAF